MKKIANLLSLLVLFSILFQSAMACGPFTVDPLFSFTRHADYPLNNYAKGKIGIVPSSYGRMSLYLFYRQLNDLPFSSKENEQYLKALTERIGTHFSDSDEEQPEPPAPKNDATEEWKKSRAKVFAGDVNLEKEKRLPDDYFYYTSCLDDSFRTASKTLEARLAKYGVNDEIKEWLNGQDAVFVNCGSGNKNPANVPDSASDWLKKDRAYQIAATLLYQEKNAEARAEFQKIANDGNSPWNKTAKFVVARTYIRQASFIDENEPDYSVTPDPNAANMAKQKNDSVANLSKEQVYPITKTIDQKKTEKAELYQKAETHLKEILTDSSMKEFHESAARLLGLIGFRAKPREQRRKLGETLAQKGENPNLYNDLIDYIWLLDKVDNDSREIGLAREQKEAEKAGKEYDYEYNLKRQDISNAELGAELTDWLFTYQAEDGYEHAFAKWKESKKLHWFVAAIAKARKVSANLAELLSEADKIRDDSVAFATIRHHQIRLLNETGKRAEARQKLNEIVPNLKNYPRSTQNDFLSQRMQLADNLGDFLKFSQRQAATFVYSDDANEVGVDMNGEKELKIWQDRQMFDYDSAAVFNEKMPISVLRQAALDPNLPNHLKKFLVIAVWSRAFVLKNSTIQKEFTPLMTKFAPEYKIPATTSEANSLLAFGRNPSIQIYIPTGYGRGETGTTEIDSIRGNWWCVENRNEMDFPDFLSEEEKKAAKIEKASIISAGESATFLAQRAVEFANNNTTNPSVPEILHLAVRATRYGCRDNQTLKFSKAAFDILHKKYPKSPWTKKTPYYFGEREE